MIVVRLMAAVAVLSATAACTGPSSREAPAVAGPERREVLLDLGTADVVDLRPVTVQAAPGDVVVLRSGNPGRGLDDESPVHHLFTSAPADAPLPLFARAGAGVLPNPGVWGMCRGGSAAAATAGCPLPAIEGPQAYDGQSYVSLGGLLPGESRELPLADDLAEGTYRLTCAVHPQHHVDVEVVADPRPGQRRPRLDAGAAVKAASAQETKGVVLLGPQTTTPPAEVLRAAPAEVRVPVGGTVVWRTAGRAPHTVELGEDHPPHLADTAPADTVPVVPAGGRWDGTGEVRSGVLSSDPSVARQEFRLTFTRPGTYHAYDRFVPTATTTIRVG